MSGSKFGPNSLAELFAKGKKDENNENKQNKNTSCPPRKQSVRHNFSIFDNLYQNSSEFNRNDNNNKSKQQNKSIFKNITNSIRNKTAKSRKRYNISQASQNIDNKRRKTKQKKKYNRSAPEEDEILSDCASLIGSPENSSPYTVNSIIKKLNQAKIKMKQAKTWADNKLSELYDNDMSCDDETDANIVPEIKIDEEYDNDVEL